MKLLSFLIFITTFCWSLVANSAAQITVVDKNNQSVKDIVVYLTPLDGQQYSDKSTPIQVNQKDKAFSPYLTVGQANQAVSFRNDDDITHHIYSAVGENKFSFKIKAGQQVNKTDFTQPATIAMGCNIHDWMGGYLLLLDTPLFTKTNSQGLANFEQPLSGQFQLTVWHPELQTPDNRQQQIIRLPSKLPIAIQLANELSETPEQISNDDFDFLSDYD